VVIYHGVALDYDIYPTFVFSLFITSYVLIFTHLFFVLLLYLLPLSLAPTLYLPFSSMHPGSARGIFTML